MRPREKEKKRFKSSHSEKLNMELKQKEETLLPYVSQVQA